LILARLDSDRAPAIAVVILNHNGQDLLRRFLPSVLEHSQGQEIIVADNGSEDGSLALLEQEFPQVRIISFAENLGFCQGYNQALAQVEATYYVLLNSDVEVTPGWLEPMLQLLEENLEIGACQPKIRSFNQRQFLEYAGAAGGYIDRWGYPFCRGRLFESVEEDKGQYNDNRPIFWATGACLMVRARLYAEMGGLDPDFFAHMEEIDFCWRLQNAGYQVYYCGQAHVYHLGGGTLPGHNPRKVFYNFRNGLELLYKNLPDACLSSTIRTRLVLDGIAASRMLLAGNLAAVKAVWQAHRHYFRNKSNRREKRKAAGPKKALSKLNGYYPQSIVWQYFINRKKKFSDLKVPDSATFPT
jgi:GT2 family glycosyltransferase